MPDQIGDICRQDYPDLSRDTAVRVAVENMLETGCSVAPVTDDGGMIVGILSLKDCFDSALKAAYYQQWQGTVGEHMSGEIETLDAETDHVSAAQTFIERPFRVFPVVRDGRLVGMLRREDLLAAFLRFS